MVKLQARLGWWCCKPTCSASSRGSRVVVFCRVASCSCLHPLGLAILWTQACSMRSPLHEQGLSAYLELVCWKMQPAHWTQPVRTQVAGALVVSVWKRVMLHTGGMAVGLTCG